MFQLVLNYWVLAGAAVTGLVVCFLWYSPFLFGDLWIEHSGLSKTKQQDEQMWLQTFFQFILNLLLGYVLYGVMTWALVLTMSEALVVASLLWLGFILTREMSTTIWAKRSLQVALIDAGGMLLTMLVMAAILFQWG